MTEFGAPRDNNPSDSHHEWQRLCAVGIDFGTDSVRSVVVDTSTGAVLGTSVKYYPRWAKGLYCDPIENRFRQHPLDYLESMEASLLGHSRRPARRRGSRSRNRRGHNRFDAGVGGPLRHPARAQRGVCREPKRDVRAWKDHTAVAEAERLNQLARTWGGTDYTKTSAGFTRRSGSGPRRRTSSRRTPQWRKPQ